MNSKHIAINLSVAFVIFVALVAFVTPVQAQECTTQYGGSTTCVSTDVSINKQVAEPVVTKGGITASGTFVENLGTANPFTPGSEIEYRLTVKNTSDHTLDTVTVKDVLPQYLTFVSGPGSYDANTRTLTVVLNTMTAGETRTVDILTKVVDAKDFPANQNMFCVTNYAEARASDKFASDTAQVCLQPAATLPVAGFNDLTLLLPFAGVGLSGIALLKKRG